ncbi:MotA/TolQ/ExbB proton channel family protein [Roseateles sp. SL47]|jgi:biopolymer transport protein ExbB|uniref:MotA/TolQ/ExbB proton channel family protein n=1 Tax=Roseateles sp. SL47 TaxID=2995138 RepID=UPI00226E670A|nr:MotA/TolQ/ExbB proton channel family protein [Roseateles sp. SL47]WAC74427.1 MotA/TolQ/ExbB proton channel family protein [Roseateles sp. SL47]
MQSLSALGLHWQAADGVARLVALLLLVMSISSWVLILWRAWMLTRARRDLQRGLPLFWAAADITAGRQQLLHLDREGLMVPLVDAALSDSAPGSLGAAGRPHAQLTRRLRDALHLVLAALNRGQVVLATVGSTAPFIGLFGTVWGIYHALQSMAGAGDFSLDKVAGPVGEALIMTAAGLAVAIPAVLAYNLFGKWVAACEAELEGFAHDLRELRSAP